MPSAPFAPIPRLSLAQFPAGQAPSAWKPGDFMLTHGDSFTSKLIRFGESLRIHGDDKKYTWFNHAALVIGENGDLAEALGKGVVRSNAEKYRPKTYTVVHIIADDDDVAHILSFADWVLDTRHRYGWVTIASIAVTLLTGAKFTFFIDGTFICSGFVARAMERTGAIFSRDPVHIMPADLAKYYNCDPPN